MYREAKALQVNRDEAMKINETKPVMIMTDLGCSKLELTIFTKKAKKVTVANEHFAMFIAVRTSA